MLFFRRARGEKTTYRREEIHDLRKPNYNEEVMPQITTTITHAVGLHARPAALFVQTAKRYTAAITVHTGARQANAKSIVQVLTLAAGQGAELTIRAEGADADHALVALRDLIATGFREGAA
jgi:phosphotransferase system HPr (HPr) family protein